MPPIFPSPSSSGFTLESLAAGLDDPRCFPSEPALQHLGQAIMSELLDLILGSAMEDQAGLVAESLIGGLHTAALRLEREADKRRDELSAQLRRFDGSEVADHDLQAAKAGADAADVAVRAVELIRDTAAEAYSAATGETWSPWRGGVRPSVATAAQIDAAHALRSREALRVSQASPGPHVVVFRGAPGAATPDDANRIFDALNWAKASWPEMSLALTGARGAEQLAKRWASQKRVTLVLARPDFDRHGRAAPFRANDALLALQPVCVLALSRSVSSAGDLTTDGSKPFGPVLSLIQQAQQAGVRCVRIRAKAVPPA